MKKIWDLYHKNNKYDSDCQLIVAINSLYLLKNHNCKPILQDSQYYENLVDLSGSRYGSAICIEKVWKELGIEKHKEYKTFYKIIENDEKIDLPLSVSIWHKYYGYHNIVIVDFESRTKAFRIPNFKYVTTSDGWIFEEDLNHYIKPINNEIPIFSFKLK
jgi:hypothetical protein